LQLLLLNLLDQLQQLLHFGLLLINFKLLFAMLLLLPLVEFFLSFVKLLLMLTNLVYL
jgi:hypothetical protein